MITIVLQRRLSTDSSFYLALLALQGVSALVGSPAEAVTRIYRE